MSFQNKTKALYSAFSYFIIAAILGISMRIAFVIEMPDWFNYRYIQHGHSHVALLGWLFAAFYIGIIHAFKLEFRKYKSLFWALQGTVLGMLICFPLMGYQSFSIAFSTLHIILSYVFIYRVWKDPIIANASYASRLFLKASLVFLFLSTLGTCALAPLVVLGYKGGALYYGAIQFYLHFQFNGWFVFAALAIILAMLSSRGVTLDPKQMKQFFWTLVIATLLSFALAITWSTPRSYIFLVNSFGVVIQLVALLLFVRIIINQKKEIRKVLNDYESIAFLLAFIAFILKVLIQSAVVFPFLAEISYTIRNFVIGFIHLLMLGCLSFFILGITEEITKRAVDRMGTWIFFIGIFITELLLFLQGLMFWQGSGFLPYYYLLLTLGSVLIGIGLIIISFKLNRKKPLQMKKV